MNGAQILEVVKADRFLTPVFLGIFAANEIPKHLQAEQLCIVNCCDSQLPGKHWISLFMGSGEKLEFFDSYGQHPNFFKFYDKLPHHKLLLYNKNQLQTLGSNTCGLYALLFCFKRCRGHSMRNIVAKFSTNTLINDDIIKLTVPRMFFFNNYSAGNSRFLAAQI